jgi:endo-1,4-beta-xylanase
MKVPICARVAVGLFASAMLAASGPQSLREAAKASGMLVGTAVRPGLLSESAYSATLAREFNMVEAEDAMKWSTIRHDPDVFDFHLGDEIVRYAQAHGIKVRGHCLAWDHQNPAWLSEGHFNPEQMSHLFE